MIFENINKTDKSILDHKYVGYNDQYKVHIDSIVCKTKCKRIFRISRNIYDRIIRSLVQKLDMMKEILRSYIHCAHKDKSDS